MLNKRLSFAILMLTFLSGCYMGIHGLVVDAETKQPIEGAVILAEWTKTHGLGDHWTESYMVADAVTDSNGKFVLPGCYSPFVNEPEMTIYKRGYVAWSSRWIFPGWQKRADFKWGHTIFYLEYFKEGYSHDAHTSFISSSINSSLEKNYELKKSILHAVEWEQDLAVQERLRKYKK